MLSIHCETQTHKQNKQTNKPDFNLLPCISSDHQYGSTQQETMCAIVQPDFPRILASTAWFLSPQQWEQFTSIDFTNHCCDLAKTFPKGLLEKVPIWKLHIWSWKHHWKLTYKLFFFSDHKPFSLTQKWKQELGSHDFWKINATKVQIDYHQEWILFDTNHSLLYVCQGSIW